MAGMVGIQTQHRFGNQNFLASDTVVGIGNRWANRHTGGLDTYRGDRTFVHIDVEPTQIGKIFSPDFGVVSDAKAALQQLLVVARERAAAGTLKDYTAWSDEVRARRGELQRRTDFDAIPIKPQRVYQEMNAAFDQDPDTVYVSTIGLSQIAGAQLLHVFGPRRWINAGQAGPLGWTAPAALGVVRADPSKRVVALSGDYDFQFMIEELAVGAQHHLGYMGLIRQSQRAFEMDYEVSLAFDNINAEDSESRPAGYGVDHVKVAEGLGCKAVRVEDPNQLGAALEQAKRLTEEHRVPVVVEVILERVTNIAMGSELNNVNEFEDLAQAATDAPTAIVPLKTPASVGA
jgi:tartronate-semialdehyde synthase